MKPETFAVLFVAVCLLAMGFIVGGGVGSCSQQRDDDARWQADAAKRGFGTFIITDSLSGATEFQWRKP